MLACLGLLVGAGVAFHGPLLGRAAREGLQAAGRAGGIEVEVDSIDIRLGGAATFGGVRLRGGGIGGEVAIGRIEIAPARLVDLVRGRTPWIARIEITGIEGGIDLPGGGEAPPSGGLVFDPGAVGEWIERLWPELCRLEVLRFRVGSGGEEIILEDGVLGTGAGRVGEVRCGTVTLRREGGCNVLRGLGGGIAISGPGVELSDFTLVEGWLIERLVLRLEGAHAVGASCRAVIQGGTIAIEASIDTARGGPVFRGTLEAGGIDLGEAARVFASDAGIEGGLESASIAFEIDSSRPLEGSVDAALEARGLGFGGLQGGSASVRGGLADGRIRIEAAEVAIGGNSLVVNGVIDAGGGWDSGSLAIRGGGKIDFSNLEGLSSSGVPGMEGLVGAVRGGFSADGTLAKPGVVMEIQGERLGWGGVEGGTLVVEARLEDGAVHIERGLLRVGGNSFNASGSWLPRDGRGYSASLVADLRELEVFTPLFEDGMPPGGQASFEWTGSGKAGRHSGKAVISASLEGVGGDAEPLVVECGAGYSPEGIVLSDVSIRRASASVDCTISAGVDGVRIDGIALRAGGVDVAGGHASIPWNPLVLLDGRPWVEGLIEPDALDLLLEGRGVDLAELGAVFGVPVQGSVDLSASISGGVGAPVADVSVRGEGIGFGGEVVASAARFDFKAGDGIGRLDGGVSIPPVEPVAIVATVPCGLRVRNGEIEWIDPRGALDGVVTIPETDLGVFQRFVSGVRRLRGTLSGGIALGGSVAEPRVDGEVRLRGGLVDRGGGAPVLRDLRATLRFDRKTFRLVDTGGTIGAGEFELSGGGGFEDPADPSFDLRLEGREVLVLRNRDMRLRANLDLRLKGTAAAAELAGRVGLVDGRIYQELEITPLLQPDPSAAGSAMLPDTSGLVTGAPALWRLDVAIANDSPFLIVGDLATGSIEPDITVHGTLGVPVIEGDIFARDVTAFLPFSTVSIPEARIRMSPANPRVPDIDLTGYSEVLDYDIRLVIRGPMGGSGFFLNSDPPLSQEAILLMLTTGLTPDTAGGGAIGQAAIGQGGLLFLKGFARRFDLGPVDLDALVNRIGVSTYPPAPGGSTVTTRGEFRINDHFGVMAQEDSRGVAGAGMTWRWRFR